MLSGALALVIAALFTGAAIYINVAEHPARMMLDDKAALAQWRPSYVRGFAMQASLAIASTLFGLLAYWHTGNIGWFVGACLIFASWPYTLVVILPVNKRLQAIEDGKAGEESRLLMRTWATLHAGRSALGVLATASFLWALSAGAAGA